VLEILPEVVRSTNFVLHEDGTISEEPTERLGMNYAALIPVLIKSMQELHGENVFLRSKLEVQRQAIAMQAAEYAQLSEDLAIRIEKMERKVDD
jgi:hypothetical protein